MDLELRLAEAQQLVGQLKAKISELEKEIYELKNPKPKLMDPPAGWSRKR